MGGYGGSLKNIAIGCASGAHGKAQVHAVLKDGTWPKGEIFQEHMADAGKGIVDHFGNKIVYINVLRNMSIDCDCAGVADSTHTMPDLGIFASTDLVAIDQASIDLIYAMPEYVNHTLVNRIETRKGLRQLPAMKSFVYLTENPVKDHWKTALTRPNKKRHAQGRIFIAFLPSSFLSHQICGF